MKTTLTTIVVLLAMHLSCFGQAITTITYSPDNPQVGDEVTFTISGFITDCSYQVDPDADDPSVGFVLLPTATHTYTAPGVYRINLDRECFEARKDLVPDSEWELRNSTTVSLDKTITITAPGNTAEIVPTMGEWGIIVLAVLLMIFLTVAMKDRTSRAVTS